MSLFNLFVHHTSSENQHSHAKVAVTLESARPSGPQGAILVALTGEALDDEMMSVACAMARARRINEVRAVYAVEVPRAFAVTDELAEAQAKAQAAFRTATDAAAAFGIQLVTEYVQSRDSADSLVRVACSEQCGMLVMGLTGCEADTEEHPTAMVDEVLRRAPCRVWVVRDARLAA